MPRWAQFCFLVQRGEVEAGSLGAIPVVVPIKSQSYSSACTPFSLVRGRLMTPSRVAGVRDVSGLHCYLIGYVQHTRSMIKRGACCALSWFLDVRLIALSLSRSLTRSPRVFSVRRKAFSPLGGGRRRPKDCFGRRCRGAATRSGSPRTRTCATRSTSIC